MAFPDRGLTNPVRAELSFRQYGDAYFLQQVDWPGYENGLRLHPSKVETALAKNGESRRLFVVQGQTRTRIR